MLSFTLLHLSCYAQEIHSPRHPEFFNNFHRGSNIFRITPDTVLAPQKTRLQSNFFYLKLDEFESLIFTQEIERAVSLFWSFQIVFPIVLKLQQKGEQNRAGFGRLELITDMRWFLTHHFASIFRVGLQLPTTNIKRSSIVGFNHPALMLQHENIFLSRKWFIDFTIFTLIPLSSNKTRQGVRVGSFIDFTHQFYFGKEKDTNVIIGLIFNHSFSAKNKLDGIFDPNSGRFTQELGPLFSISRNDILFDIRAGYPTVERLFGTQLSIKYSLAISFQVIF